MAIGVSGISLLCFYVLVYLYVAVSMFSSDRKNLHSTLNLTYRI